MFHFQSSCMATCKTPKRRKCRWPPRRPWVLAQQSCLHNRQIGCFVTNLQFTSHPYWSACMIQQVCIMLYTFRHVPRREHGDELLMSVVSNSSNIMPTSSKLHPTRFSPDTCINLNLFTSPDFSWSFLCFLWSTVIENLFRDLSFNSFLLNLHVVRCQKAQFSNCKYAASIQLVSKGSSDLNSQVSSGKRK